MLSLPSTLFASLVLGNLAIATPPASPKTASTVRAQLRSAKIIPDVTEDFTPTLFPTLTWAKGVSSQLGNTLSVKSVQKRPSITLYDPSNPNGCVSDNKTYVVVMTDPDAPSTKKPTSSELCHWIVSGVPVSPTSASILKLPHTTFANSACSVKAKEVISYYPPSPGPKTGKHRYVSLVFAPKNGTPQPLSLTKPTERMHWGSGKQKSGASDWANKHGLQIVGASFFYAQNENAY